MLQECNPDCTLTVLSRHSVDLLVDENRSQAIQIARRAIACYASATWIAQCLLQDCGGLQVGLKAGGGNARLNLQATGSQATGSTLNTYTSYKLQAIILITVMLVIR